ncbi:MAG: T9SS type A sorting domain-containing protein [bacterium]|nr:T9SS type A sorting domain-containing protein [bacterium]
MRAVVYDVLGREVARLADEAFIAGQHRLSVQATAWSSGVYFLRFETLGQIETRKMLLFR